MGISLFSGESALSHGNDDNGSNQTRPPHRDSETRLVDSVEFNDNGRRLVIVPRAPFLLLPKAH